ncbi:MULTISPECIES: mannose-6-phosphate isomerase, class I [unclassified Streptomyces]|uniref:mannose-6-phosphate isomerase, class I n=1 Tax=unclassified Streptomyces TaxID=2593676 RepID=UPI00070168C4|nr:MULTISPECIES: mannose-6-phosphate isomerase, class I [unclassified Streptomyces]KQX48144.1 mannose-6-phosphate isomerase [Streptomyces sp. Root1304]KRA82526.1 mannose-6-phosphate isomerase [Streptomyces sp. Root66D1]
MDLLRNTVQPYDWGSRTLLPDLMGVPPTGAPQAELWMGAHPAAPSRVSRNGTLMPLDRVVAEDPEGELGAVTMRRFGPRLPFLVKLLAADAPLSVQVHPDLAQAQAGFAREDALGVPLDAAHRNYRDDQHKPEMIVALTPFRGLCGFRNPADTAALLDSLKVPALRPYAETLRIVPEAQALSEVFRAFLRPPADLLDAAARALAVAAAGSDEAHVAAYDRIARAYPGDSGLLSALMLRYVELDPGEALFLGAGVPHAYLSGLGVEIMASSDNVLRCGLTSKHVDAEELTRVVRFDAPPARVLTPREEEGEEAYPAPVDDFRLSRYVLRAGGPRRRVALDAPQILLCVTGRATVSSPGGSLDIGPGQAVYVPAGAEAGLQGTGTAFRATTGTAEHLG